MENLFNVNQAAFILKVHPLTVRRYIRERKIQALKAGGNIRIPESALPAFTKSFNPPASTVGKRKKAGSVTQPFVKDDPFLRMEGRGASLTASQ